MEFIYDTDSLKQSGNYIVANFGQSKIHSEMQDEKVAIMVNFFNQVENKKEKTKGIFSSKVSVWSTNEMQLNLPKPVGLQVVSSAQRSATRMDDFTDPIDSGMQFKYFENKNKDIFATDGGKSGYLISLPNDKTEAQAVMEKLCSVDFGEKGTQLA
jgi:hypothetical protein